MPGHDCEQLFRSVDRRADPCDEREAVFRVTDREREHILEPPRPELLEEQQPAAERAGNAGGKHAGPRDEVVAERAEALDRRGLRRDALAAEGDRLATFDRPENRRHLAARAVQVRLDDLKRQPVATAASNALPPRSRTAMPAADASQCVEATMPNVPRSSGRVVKRHPPTGPKIRHVVVPCASSLPALSMMRPSAVATRPPRWMTVPSQRISPVSAVIGRTKFVFTSSVV